MDIYFYNYAGDDKVINKTLGEPTVSMVNGTLRDDCDLIDPIILVHSDPRGSNYAWIPEFNRWYFINDIEVVRTGLWQISCHVDVLKTYEPWIKNCDIIVTRTSAKPLDLPNSNDVGFNAMLVDPNVPMTQTTRNRECVFGFPFGWMPSYDYFFSWDEGGSYNYYLVTVG